MTKSNLSIKERFMLYVQKPDDPNGCWEWVGGNNGNGYGTFRIKNKKLLAHRVSFDLFKGEILNGLFVCHSCDNRACVNPSHLFLGTQQDNLNDMKNKNRQHNQCGIKNPNHKLNEYIIYEIRDLVQKGYLQKDIAKMFNINKSTISYIKNKKIWNHIK